MTSPNTLQSEKVAPDSEQTPVASPFIHEFFMVQADDFRGMAYCEASGKWRAAFTDEVLIGEVCVFD